jgi:DNA repair protein RadC
VSTATGLPQGFSRHKQRLAQLFHGALPRRMSVQKMAMLNDPTPLHNSSALERLVYYGVRSLDNADLISILLRRQGERSTLVQAQALMAELGHDLYAMGRMGPDDLVRSVGLTKRNAAAIVAAVELGRRRREEPPMNRHLVNTSRVAYEILRPALTDLSYEEFWLLLLDRGHRLLGKRRVSQGGMHGTVADPKIIYKTALDAKASALIIAHNHPSGQLRPSEEDIRLTKKLVEGGRLLDIDVHDHVIIADTGYYSFADNGQM